MLEFLAHTAGAVITVVVLSGVLNRNDVKRAQAEELEEAIANFNIEEKR